MHKETSESVRAVVTLFALYTITMGALQFGLGAVYDLTGGLLMFMPGLAYAHVAMNWYPLIENNPKRIRIILWVNLLFVAIFGVYRMIQSGDSVSILGVIIAFFGTVFVLGGVAAYSAK